MDKVLSQKLVTTRSTHSCFGCRRLFPTGTLMEKVNIANGKGISAFYICPSCQEVINNFEIPGEPFGEGDLLQDVNSLTPSKELKAYSSLDVKAAIMYISSTITSIEIEINNLKDRDWKIMMMARQKLLDANKIALYALEVLEKTIAESESDPK